MHLIIVDAAVHNLGLDWADFCRRPEQNPAGANGQDAGQSSLCVTFFQ
ncbi:MAG: hypothetical protein HS114_18450 [Anaerolineales bacterium]|nr:hypothetical protein [Anaerolineales bacterium]